MNQRELQELLSYSIVTGHFTWKVKLSRKTVIGSRAGSVRKDGYVVIRLYGQKYYAHILTNLYVLGCMPCNVIDHEDGNTSNNCWLNLREVTHQDNLKNQSKRTTNISGVTGVHWCSTRNRWMAQINTGHKAVNLGRFLKYEDAVTARKTAEVKYGFHNNHGRDAI